MIVSPPHTTKHTPALLLITLFAFFALVSLPVLASLRVPTLTGSWVVTVNGQRYRIALGQTTTTTQPAAVSALASLDQARVAWALDLLTALGNTQPSLEIIAMVVAWQNGENTGAAFNPLATTQTAPGATCWNKLPSMLCGVKNYTSREQGLQATVETLTNGFYPNILAGLQTNNPAQVLNDGELATWGTGRGLVEQQYQLQLALLAQPLQNTQPTTSGEKCPVTQPEMHINAHFSDTNSGYWAGQIGGMHNGVDIGGTPGQPVYAPFTMTIEDIQYYGDAGRIGWYVQSRLGDGYLFYAGHLGTTTVQVGQHVAACTQIGTIGEVFHVHVKIAPPEAPVPCEPYARPDGHPWCEDFLSYYDAH